MMEDYGRDEGKAEEANGITGQEGDTAVEKPGFTVLDGYRRMPTHKLFKSMAQKVIGGLANLPASR
jgi:hypothetical protein